MITAKINFNYLMMSKLFAFFGKKSSQPAVLKSSAEDEKKWYQKLFEWFERIF